MVGERDNRLLLLPPGVLGAHLLLTASLGPLDAEVSRALGGLLAIVVAVTAVLPWPGVRSIGLLLLATPVLVLARETPACTFAFSTLLLAAALARRDGPMREWLRGLTRVSFAFSAWWAARGTWPWLCELEQGAARFLSGLVGAGLGVELEVGASYAGLYLCAFHMALIAFVLPGTARLPVARRLAWVALPLVSQLAFLAILAGWIAQPERASGLTVNELLLVRFLVESCGLVLLVRLAPAGSVAPRPTRGRTAAVAPALALSALLVLAGGRALALRTAAQQEGGRVLVLGGTDGSYAELLGRCAAWGFEVERVPDLDAFEGRVGGGDALLLLFPIPASVGSPAAIVAAVEAGAGLWIAADHTNALRHRDRLAPLLAALDLGLGNDSSFPTRRRRDSFELHDHPLRRAWAGSARPFYGVGASVAPSPGGAILAVGRYDFADAADENGVPDNFLGDRTLAPGERLGDVVLAAEVERGRGRAILMGDPTPLLGDSLAVTGASVRETLEYLCAGPWSPATGAILRSLGAAMLCGAGLLALLRGGAVLYTAPAWALTLAFLPLVSAGGEAAPRGQAPLAVLHTGAMEELSLGRSGARTVGGLVETLTHAGFAVDVAEEAHWSTLRAGDAVLLIGPRVAPRDEEVRAALEFASRGGHLLLAIGWRHRAVAEPFLRALGARLLPRVVQRGIDREGALEWGTDEVVLREPYALDVPVGAEAWVVREGLAVVSSFPHGDGSLTVLADPLFPLGKNLVYEGGAFAANQALVLRALGRP